MGGGGAGIGIRFEMRSSPGMGDKDLTRFTEGPLVGRAGVDDPSELSVPSSLCASLAASAAGVMAESIAEARAVLPKIPPN